MEGRKVQTSGTPLKYPSFLAVGVNCPLTEQASSEVAEESESLS